MESRQYARHLLAGQYVRYMGGWYLVVKAYEYPAKNFPLRDGWVELALIYETDRTEKVQWFEMPTNAMVTVRD